MVTTGYTKTLEVSGTGYCASLRGAGLELQLGFSHPVQVDAPEGIKFAVRDANGASASNGID